VALTCVELRAHSAFSFGDGAMTPEALAARAAELGYPAIGLTDCADLGGVPRFVVAAEKRGVRPIVGAELEVDGHPAAFLVQSREGYRNLAALVTCARVADGRMVWQKNMKNFGASMPGFGFVESPFIDGNLVLLSPGGSVVALNKLNGATVWQSKKLKGSTDYSSLSVAETGRVKQYLVMTDKSVGGVLATSGAILWEGDFPGDRAVVPTPVYNNGIVFVAAGYGVGCKAFKVGIAGDRMVAQEAYAGTQFQIHHGGMVLVNEHVYGLHDQGTLRCIELATGKQTWQDRNVGKGSIAYADGHLYCRGESGSVSLVEANPNEYKVKGTFTPPERNGSKTWAHPAVSGGKLFLREQDVLLAYNVKE